MSKIDNTYHQLLNNILEVGYKYSDPNRKGVKRLEILNHTFRHEFKDGFPAISTKKLHYKNVVTELLWFLKGDTNIKYLVDNGCNIWNKDAYNYYKKHFNNKHAGFSQNLFTLTEFINYIKQGINLDNIQGIGITIGDLGPVYGHQWRKSGSFNDSINEYSKFGIDQISNLIKSLKKKPLGTEHIVNSWNASDKPLMALPPCHYGFQVVVRPLSRGEMLLYQTAPIDPVTKRVMFEESIKYGFELHWSQRSVDTFLG